MPDQSPNSTSYAETAGLILAGGHGARLGVMRKADLLVGGHRLLDLAVNNLGTQCQQIFIAAGDHAFAAPVSDSPPNLVVDPGRGPAAALLFAAGQIKSIAPAAEFVLAAPCDAPFMPSDFAELATAGIDKVPDANVGTFAGRTYPTHCLWRLSALIQLRDRYRAPDNPSIFELLDLVSHRKLPFDTETGENPFFNINNPADLVVANRRFASISEASFS